MTMKKIVLLFFTYFLTNFFWFKIRLFPLIVINNHYMDLKVCSKEEISTLNKCKICPQNQLGYE